MGRRRVGAVALGMILLFALSCSTAGKRSPEQVKQDDAISREVRSLLAADRSMAGADITVRTFNGEVTLQGPVKDAIQIRMAEEIAREADGVVQVINWLEVVRPRFFLRKGF